MNLRTLLLLLVAAPSGWGQNQTELRQEFEGRTVRVKTDMPATGDGIDLSSDGLVLESSKVEERRKKFGIALPKGRTAKITEVKLKGRTVEVHLDGGGFTYRDEVLLPSVDSIVWGYTDEERRLKSAISSSRDKAERDRREYRYETTRRRRTRPLREKMEAEKRLAMGSRFNIRFDQQAAITPEAVRAALSVYVEFR